MNDFPSVSETFISNKIKFLATRGHDLHVICNYKNTPLFNEIFINISNVTVHSFRKKNVLSFVLLHPRLFFSSVNKKAGFTQTVFSKFRIFFINGFNPDIIHFEFSGIGTDYVDDIRLLTGRKVVSCRGSAEKVKLLVYAERKEKFKALLEAIDAVHCVSADMVNTIAPYCSKMEKVFINFPSIDTSYFKREQKKEPSTQKVILSVGRMTFQKGYIMGLLAIKMLTESGIDFKWIIAGNGPKYEEIIIAIQQLGLEKYVTLPGARSKEQVKELMETADVFFLPSMYEGIANVVLEAMSMEVPVIATKSGGMEEVIEDGVDGFLTSVNDYKLMATRMQSLLLDTHLCTRLGSLARKKVVDKFNIERQIDTFEKVYTQLLTHSFTAHN